MKKHIFTLLITLTILLTTTPNLLAINGNMGGPTQDGSADHPYLIEDFNDFKVFCENSHYWDDYTRLDCDLDLDSNLPDRRVYYGPLIAWDTRPSEWGWDGITYTGNFDGNGHTIINLIIHGSEYSFSGDYCGLFGYMSNGAEIKDLGLNISVTGHRNVGGLVGYNDGSITRCYSNSLINGYAETGGLVGYNDGNITNSYSTGLVSGNWSIGGLIGDNNGGITCGYSASSVTGNKNQVGGLVGYNYYGSTNNGYFYLYGAGNGVGQPLDDDQLQDKTSFIGFDFAGDSSDGSDDYWTISPGHMPRLAWQDEPGFEAPYILDTITTTLSGSGYSGDPFVIADYNDLLEFKNNSALMAGYYSLASDIDLAGITYTGAFITKPFSGHFNGNNYAIKNLTINGGDYLGFFSRLFGFVNNLALESISITGSSDYVGGLVGYNEGCVSYSYSNGSITGLTKVGGLVGYNYLYGSISNNYSACSVAGNKEVGGLVGYNCLYGSISDNYANGSVAGYQDIGGLVGYNYHHSSISNSYATGSVTGDEKVGGLVGYNYHHSSISNSYATGSVIGDEKVGILVGYNDYNSSISDSYATGANTGSNPFSNYVNRIVGYNHNSVITNCFWDVETSSIGKSGDEYYGATGKTTAEMKTVSTFLDAEWDLVNVWNIEESQTYPLLRKYSAFDTNYDNKVNFIDFADFANNWLSGVE